MLSRCMSFLKNIEKILSIYETDLISLPGNKCFYEQQKIKNAFTMVIELPRTKHVSINGLVIFSVSFVLKKCYEIISFFFILTL